MLNLYITLVLLVSGMTLSSGWDNFLFRPYCERDELQTIFGMCYNILHVSSSNALDKRGYSAATTGTVSIAGQATKESTPASFTIVAEGKIKVSCTTSAPKQASDSGEFIWIYPVRFADQLVDLKPLIEGKVTKTEQVFSWGATISHQRSTLPLTCTWTPHLGVQPPQIVHPGRVYACTVDQPGSCIWTQKNNWSQLADLMVDLTARPELSHSGKGLLGVTSADCTRNDDKTLSCTYTPMTFTSRLAPSVDVDPMRLFRGGRITSSTWRCEVKVYSTGDYKIFFKPTCWVK